MKKTNALITIFAVLVVIAIINFLTTRHPWRLDLTEGRVYTLSAATKKILAGLDDIVTIRVYFTKDLPPALQNLRRDVDDILAEFKNAAGTRLQVEQLNPSASQLEEQQAVMIGIPPIQLNVLERDKQEVAKVFLGIAVLFGNKQQTIPVVQRVDNLEYDLAEAIVKISSKELPTVAWLEGPTDIESGKGFRLVKEAIARRYKFRPIDANSIGVLDPHHIKALVLASPRMLSDNEIFAIDQYLMGGGHIMALIDRHEMGEQLAVVPIETNAVALLAHYGVSVEDALVLDQSNAMATFSGGVVAYHLPYPYWPDVRRGGFDHTNPIVANLESIVFPWTSPLTLASGDTSSVALAKTSPQATQVSGKEARVDPQSANDALITGNRGARTLAALVSGPFGSFSMSSKIPSEKESLPKLESSIDASIFVVGSSHWLTDRVLSAFPANATLFENTLDSFAMGDVLIGIRSRENTSRPIAQLSDGVRLITKYANIAIGPIIVIVIGFAVLIVRRIRKRRIQSR